MISLTTVCSICGTKKRIETQEPLKGDCSRPRKRHDDLNWSGDSGSRKETADMRDTRKSKTTCQLIKCWRKREAKGGKRSLNFYSWEAG